MYIVTQRHTITAKGHGTRYMTGRNSFSASVLDAKEFHTEADAQWAILAIPEAAWRAECAIVPVPRRYDPSCGTANCQAGGCARG